MLLPPATARSGFKAAGTERTPQSEPARAESGRENRRGHGDGPDFGAPWAEAAPSAGPGRTRIAAPPPLLLWLRRPAGSARQTPPRARLPSPPLTRSARSCRRRRKVAPAPLVRRRRASQAPSAHHIKRRWGRGGEGGGSERRLRARPAWTPPVCRFCSAGPILLCAPILERGGRRPCGAGRTAWPSLAGWLGEQIRCSGGRQAGDPVAHCSVPHSVAAIDTLSRRLIWTVREAGGRGSLRVKQRVTVPEGCSPEARRCCLAHVPAPPHGPRRRRPPVSWLAPHLLRAALGIKFPGSDLV